MSEQAEPPSQSRGDPSEVAVARDAVVQALRGLELGERDSMEGLHRALCDLVGALRRAGRSCDDVVADVRSIISTPVTAVGATKVPALAREALVELTLRWCADEYGQTEGTPNKSSARSL